MSSTENIHWMTIFLANYTKRNEIHIKTGCCLILIAYRLNFSLKSFFKTKMGNTIQAKFLSKK